MRGRMGDRIRKRENSPTEILNFMGQTRDSIDRRGGVAANGRSPGCRILVLLLLPLAAIALAGPAFAFKLAPYKDKLFQYPKILDTGAGGAFEHVDYSKQRDLYGRDEVLEIRAHRRYVSLKPARRQKNLTLEVGGRTLKYIGLGKLDGRAKAVVIYVHGQGGSRLQGSNDWTFGGNFNRIKNLMLRNDGVYVSTDISDFGPKGRDDVKALMQSFAARSPGAPIFVACGSMGGHVCWSLIKDREAARLLGGILLLGSVSDRDFLGSAAFTGGARPVPIYLGHGSEDNVFDWRSQEAFFKTVKTRRPDYPIRFTLFETGSHGTPIRMTDWRLILNWMLAAGS